MFNSYTNMMSGYASASFANAAFTCAHTARNIVVVLGAILMASIIICALAVRLSTLALLVLVLLAILLVAKQVNTPRARMTA